MRAGVVYNPTARGNHARRARAALGRLGGEVELCPTTGPGSAAELAAELCRRGWDTVVAAGGDGTVSEVVDGMARVAGALEQVRLGVLPLGTINVFARELGLPRSLAAAWALICSGSERRVDLPEVELAEETAGGRRRRAFVQLAGCGLDSRAIAAVDWKWKQRVGPLAYVRALARVARGPQPRVRLVAGASSGEGELVLVGNGRLFGGAVTVFPEADLADGILEARVFPRVTWMTLCRFGLAWCRGRPLVGADTLAFRGDRLAIEGAAPLPVEVDGDNVGWLPAVFTVRPGALRVLAS